MNIYTFKINGGIGDFELIVKGSDAPDALGKLCDLLRDPTIKSMVCGNEEEGKTRFPEMRARRLYREPREKELFSPELFKLPALRPVTTKPKPQSVQPKPAPAPAEVKPVPKPPATHGAPPVRRRLQHASATR